MREYNKEIGGPDWVEIFTIDDMIDQLINGAISNYDGSGYWVKDGLRSMDECFSTPQLDATHIAWYNK